MCMYKNMTIPIAWMGPILITKEEDILSLGSHMDIEMNDLEDIIDFFLSYGRDYIDMLD